MVASFLCYPRPLLSFSKRRAMDGHARFSVSMPMNESFIGFKQDIDWIGNCRL